jgi:hypothetical protein
MDGLLRKDNYESAAAGDRPIGPTIGPHQAAHELR